jgi:hypothetical protein
VAGSHVLILRSRLLLLLLRRSKATLAATHDAAEEAIAWSDGRRRLL